MVKKRVRDYSFLIWWLFGLLLIHQGLSLILDSILNKTYMGVYGVFSLIFAYLVADILVPKKWKIHIDTKVLLIGLSSFFTEILFKYFYFKTLVIYIIPITILAISIYFAKKYHFTLKKALAIPVAMTLGLAIYTTGLYLFSFVTNLVRLNLYGYLEGIFSSTVADKMSLLFVPLRKGLVYELLVIEKSYLFFLGVLVFVEVILIIIIAFKKIKK